MWAPAFSWRYRAIHTRSPLIPALDQHEPALLVWHGVGTSHILCWRAPKESHKSHHLCVTKGWDFDIRDTRTQLIWQKRKFAVKCGHILFILLSRGRDAFGCTVRRKNTVKMLVIRKKTAIKSYFITDTVKIYFKRSYLSFYCKYCEIRTINNLIIHGEHVFSSRLCIFKNGKKKILKLSKWAFFRIPCAIHLYVKK